jgi:hypothetical protein
MHGCSIYNEIFLEVLITVVICNRRKIQHRVNAYNAFDTFLTGQINVSLETDNHMVKVNTFQMPLF